MVFKLYGYPHSGNTRIVAAILSEKDVPFELVQVDLDTKEHRAPGYLDKQPFGQVPVIDDDGYILYESRAICRYIAAKYTDQGVKLIPNESIQATGLFEQAASIELTNFAPHAGVIVYEMVAKPRFKKLETDKAAVERSLPMLSSKLDVYDGILGKQKYLAGNDITLVDLFHLPLGTKLAVAGIDITANRPNVARWFNELSSRESWTRYKDGVHGTPS